jgi:hypothetical protein
MNETMKTILPLLFLLFSNSLLAQRKVSVVELFCNTGDYDARLAIPSLNDQAIIADTNDENHIFIQHHVNHSYPSWTDQYANGNSTNRYNQYLGLGIVDSISGISVNGVSSVATPWHNCNPIEKEIYSSGAKKVSLLFESYDAVTSKVTVRFVLARKYTEEQMKFIHVFMLESGLSVNVTAGENMGETFIMNNVSRGVRTEMATVYSDTVQFTLPAGANIDNIQFVGYVQDDVTAEILGGTRGFKLKPYIDAPGTKFAVVEMFCNTGCYGGPPAISSMVNYSNLAETNNNNEALLELHIPQIYGNWQDLYALDINNSRYDKYSWGMGILAGLAAVAKNGIRYTPDSWSSCKPKEKTSISFVDLEIASYSANNLIMNYTLSGELGSHDRVYFYVVESGITILVTGAEIPGTTLNMNNVARVGIEKTTTSLVDTVLLQIPTDVNLQNARVMAYIQNDVTYEVTGGTKGLELDNAISAGIIQIVENKDFIIYPNPTNSDVTLLLENMKGLKNAQLFIYDVNGQIHYTRSLEIIPSVLNIADHQMSKGIYFVKIQSDEMNLTQKLELF